MNLLVTTDNADHHPQGGEALTGARAIGAITAPDKV